MVNLFIELNYKDFPILAKFYAAGSVIAFHDFHKNNLFFGYDFVKYNIVTNVSE